MEEGVRQRRPRYIDEDTSPTTERELQGWYSYAIAAEVFAVSGTGSFLPVTLEQLARERGVLKSDGVTSCVKSAAESAVRFLSRRADEAQQDDACVVNVLGSKINTSSFALYTFSLAVGIQALVLVSISAIADHGNYRKRFLLTLAWTGATACMLFIFISPSLYLLAPLLVVISVCCLGNGFALLNSFLPLLIANHSGALRDTQEYQFQPVAGAEDGSKSVPTDLALSNSISAKGTGLGYAAALFVQVLSIGILILMNALHLSSSATLPMRVVLLLVGVWWAAFTIPTYLWLRPRPGPRLQAVPITTRRWLQPVHYVGFAWRSLFATVKTALKLKQVCIFLVAWFLMSDAIATISGVAILFARTELHMETPAIALVSITATINGVLGATLWPRIQKYFKLETNHVIIACVCLSEIIPLYGLLGFVLPVLGLRSQWEIFPMACIHGFVMGGLSSFCRSFYSVLIPPGSEAAFYALYAVTDKGSSVIGPAVVGRIVDATGSVRMGFWFLAVLVVLPIPLMWWVDTEAGRKDAQRLVGAGDDAAEHVPLADNVGRRSTDEDGDEAFGLLDSDDELEYLPDRGQE